MSKYSVTSNRVKLFKHLAELRDLQFGKVTPIMIHFIPTHKCQLQCSHCCFKNRQDKTADMPWETFVRGISQFYELGTRALEFTGGGDPTLWPYINLAIDFLHNKMHMGIITNGLSGDRIKHWDWFDWVRVSMNTLEYRDSLDLSYLVGTKVSFCYIWHENSGKYIEKIAKFVNKQKVICRVAPDCIKPIEEINKDLKRIKKELEPYEGKYLFLSDFNIETKRRNNNCRIHMIKPCFYLDGWIYSCPSAELAVENNRQVQPKARICEYTNILKWYKDSKASKPINLDCSYCKYVAQQEILEDVLTETEFNEFC